MEHSLVLHILAERFGLKLSNKKSGSCPPTVPNSPEFGQVIFGQVFYWQSSFLLAIAAGTLPGEHFLLENFLVEQFVGVHRAVWAVAGLALEAEAEQPPQCGRGGHRGSCTHNKYKIKLSEKVGKKDFQKLVRHKWGLASFQSLQSSAACWWSSKEIRKLCNGIQDYSTHWYIGVKSHDKKSLLSICKDSSMSWLLIVSYENMFWIAATCDTGEDKAHFWETSMLPSQKRTLGTRLLLDVNPATAWLWVWNHLRTVNLSPNSTCRLTFTSS